LKLYTILGSLVGIVSKLSEYCFQVIYTFIVLEITDVLWKILLPLVKDVEEELQTIGLM
jgi:hypothetical protein